MRKYIHTGILLFMVLFFAQRTYAQVSGGYWGNQYGSRGFLLNGAIIGSVDDETAIFYNPAALGLSHKFGVSLSIITPRYNIVSTDNILGSGNTLNNEGIGFAPGLVAAEIKPFKADWFNMGFTIFERFKSKLNFNDRVVNIIPDRENTLFVGELEYNRDFGETWVGLGASVSLFENLSIGLSNFITWRKERVDLRFKKDFIERSNPNKLEAAWRSQFKYSYFANAGTVSKIGLSWRPGDIKIGVTYTSPTYALVLRRANYKYADSRLSFDGEAKLISNKKAAKLNEYKTPWSLGVGVEFDVKNNRISFSAEYFSKIHPFDIIDDTDDPLDGKSGVSEPVRTRVTLGSNGLVNVALGVEKIITDDYSVFLAARTDMSPKNVFNLNDGVSFLSSDPDIYHTSLGFSYLYGVSKFSVGIDYGFGFKSGGRQIIDLNDVRSENLFKLSTRDVVNTDVYSISLFLTYNL